MQTLRIFENAVEAEILRTRLDAAGILAVVNGGEVATMLSHLGTAAVKVRVEVAPEDYQRALELLEEDDADRAEKTAWKCSRCDERNEPLFDLCWYCGKTRGDADSISTDDPDAKPTSAGDPSGPPVDADDSPRRRRPDDNPYAPPSIAEARHRRVSPDELEPASQPDPQLVERVSRIFRGAVIGTVLMPPLLALYVLTQLMFRVPRQAYRMPTLRRRLIASWALCWLSIAVAAIIWNFVLY